MDEQTEQQPKVPAGAALFLAEWLLLTTMVAVSYMALDSATGGLVSVVIALAYVLYLLWPGMMAYRKRRDASGPDRWTQFYAGMYWGSGGIAAIILIVAVGFAWIGFAFDAERHLADFKVLGSIWVLVALIGLSWMAVAYLGSLALLRRRGAISGNLAGFIRVDVLGMARSPLVASFAFTMAIVGLLSTVAAVFAMEGLANTLTPDRDANFLDVAVMFPFLPLGLLASTALLTVARTRWTSGAELVSRVRAHLEHGAKPAAWPGLVTGGASIVAVFAVLYPIHFGLVAAASPVVGIAPWNAANSAIETWIAARRNEGLGGAEIAARLTRHGRWALDAPNAGLAALMPDLGTELSKHGDICRITVAAGTADPSAVAGSGWIPAETARSDIKYCLRVACSSPLTWDAPPALLLTSSHPSRNRFWAETAYIDVFANGAAVEPGGYCTADGKLAADFRG